MKWGLFGQHHSFNVFLSHFNVDWLIHASFFLSLRKILRTENKANFTPLIQANTFVSSYIIIIIVINFINTRYEIHTKKCSSILLYQQRFCETSNSSVGCVSSFNYNHWELSVYNKILQYFWYKYQPKMNNLAHSDLVDLWEFQQACPLNFTTSLVDLCKFL